VTRKAWRRVAFGRGAATWRGTVALCDVARAPHAMKESVGGGQWAVAKREGNPESEIHPFQPENPKSEIHPFQPEIRNQKFTRSNPKP